MFLWLHLIVSEDEMSEIELLKAQTTSWENLTGDFDQYGQNINDIGQ